MLKHIIERINALHSAAMRSADQAELLRRSANDEQSLTALFTEAFEAERQAADLLFNHYDHEPTRSILYRSAAALAIECRRWRDAERCACAGLVGKPPGKVLRELRELLDQARLLGELSKMGVEVSNEELSISFFGDMIGHGFAASDAVWTRLDRTRTLVQRTAARMMGESYRDRISTRIRRAFPVMLSIPSNGVGYTMRLRIGEPRHQQELFGTSKEAELLTEVITCLKLVQEGDRQQVERHIQDEVYTANFIALAKQIAPDGEKVRAIDFTVQRPRLVDHFQMTRVRRDINLVQEYSERTFEIRGELRGADETGHRNTIKLTDIYESSPRISEESITITVEEGLLADIVKPLWGERVWAIVVQSMRRYFLVDIAEDDDF